MTGEQIHIVGVDDGYAAIKVAWMNGNGMETRVFPSRAVSGLHGVTDMAGEAVGGYRTQGQSFTVGIEGLPNIIDTRFDDYPTSDLNRVLVHHALSTSGFAGQSCRLATGLPFTDFYRDPARRDAKIASLAKSVETISGADSVHITQQSVFPEAAIAWIDITVDDEGNLVGDLDAPVAIVDIGGRTTDIAIMLPGRQIDQDRSGTEQLGVLDVHQQIRDRASHSDRFGVPISAAAAERGIRSRVLRLWGKDQDISDLVDSAIDDLTRRVVQVTQQRIGRGQDLDRVIVIGGGGALLRDAFGEYPNFEIPPNPEFANARGMFKYEAYINAD